MGVEGIKFCLVDKSLLGLFSRSSVLASGGCFFGVLLCLFCLRVVGVNGSVVVEWSMTSGVMSLSFPFVIDGLSLLFSMAVLFITFFIMMFSTSYMSAEIYLSRFIWLVMLFVISLNLLVFVPSMVGVILGWDGLGLISFLLVVYYQNNKSLGAGMVTAFMNRFGDALLLLSVAILSTCGHWSMWGWGYEAILSYVFVFVVVLSTTKSAQFPFSYWLPAAMSAPTPVSALVHSSTLVTAGVFLLIRVVPNVVVDSGVGGWWLLMVSAFTLFMAGVSACVELDMKKIVALSTLSQLGVMMFSLSLGYCSLAFFHLLSHALFKALLFVGVGCVIHNHDDWQDFRVVSGLWGKMPLVSGSIMMASLALSGLPFLGGFYSKDLIVESLLMGGMSAFLVVFVGVGLMMTFIYSMRLFLKSVCGNPSQSVVQVGESLSIYEVVPMVSLGLASSFGGWFLQSTMFEFGELFLLEVGFKGFMTFVFFCGAVVVSLWALVAMVKLCYSGVLKKFFLSFFSSMLFVKHSVSIFNVSFLKTSQLAYKVVDLGWNEYVLGGLGVFDYLVMLNSRVLSFWWGVMTRCLLLSAVVLVLSMFVMGL